MTGRTDTYVLVVSNHETGQRYSFVGSKKECEEEAEAKRKEWGKRNSEALIEKR